MGHAARQAAARSGSSCADPASAIANVVYTWDPTCFIFATPWVDESDGFPDMHAVPDLASFRVAGWTEGVGIVMCDTVNVDDRTSRSRWTPGRC